VESFAKVDKADELIDEEMSSDDVAGILLRYEGGARGAVTISQVSAGEKNSVRYEVAGSEASLSWHSQRPDQLIIGHRDRPNEMMYRDPMNSAPEASRNMLYPVGHVEGFPDTFRALFSQVYRAVLGGGGEGTYPTFADGHDAVLVTEAVATSHADERWTTIKRQENRT
jgi:predicted dehydrogenase